MKRFFLSILFIVASALLVLGFALAALYLPPVQKAQKLEVKVERGEPFSSVVNKLKETGALPNDRLFSLWARMWKLDTKIHWGYYRFDAPVAPATLLGQMVLGKGLFYKVTIPEGLKLREIADALEEAGIAKKEKLLAEAVNPELLSELGFEETGIEGYLFPDTYYFPPEATEGDILTAMVEQFHVVFDPMMRQHAHASDLTPHEILTLASVIEKETGDEAERPLVSAVFHNRLKMKMPLQSDPTVIYGLETPSNNLTRKDLKNRSPYNTYRIKGLPPGPICNPGLSSLKAALFPADVPYIYFVSRNDGSHVFSVNLKDHNEAVRLYQGGGSRVKH
ncbi:MAG TPA: endolytic transglycosylase MltG [Candidatus Binatia bacterium]